jgi:hypothetical protein
MKKILKGLLLKLQGILCSYSFPDSVVDIEMNSPPRISRTRGVNVNSRTMNLRKQKATMRRRNNNFFDNSDKFKGKDEYGIPIPSLKDYDYGPPIGSTYRFESNHFQKLTKAKCDALKEYIEAREDAMGSIINSVRKKTSNGERISCDKSIEYVKGIMREQGMMGGRRRKTIRKHRR